MTSRVARTSVFLFTMLATIPFAPSVAESDTFFEGSHITLAGPITFEDVNGISSDLKRFNDSQLPAVFVDSEGGDVAAAMAIGRLLRKAGATVGVRKGAVCNSACVFILAGGTSRWVMGNVGIHRPFSTFVGEQSVQDAQNLYRASEASVRQYLKEMNVSDLLYEAMQRVPPEKIRILTEADLSGYGLSGMDPVAQEVFDSDQASVYGLSKLEYYRRKSSRYDACATQNDLPNVIRCHEAHMYGMQVEVYVANDAKAREVCPSPKDDKAKWWDCYCQFMRARAK